MSVEMVTDQWLSPRRPARVVVLGATGGIGRDLVSQLAGQGVETCGLGSSEIDLSMSDAVDRLQEVIRPNDTLILIAALTPEKGKDVQTFMKNLLMGAHVSLALQRTPCAYVIYISSDAVYADGLSLIRETSCASPSTLYGLMHLARERMLHEAAAAADFPLMVLRPCTLYGATDTHNAYGPNRFLRSALRDRAITLFGEGEERRDHLQIEDLSRLITWCVTHRTTGLLNAATGQSLSFAAVAKAVASLFDNPVRIDFRARQQAVTHRHFDTTALLRAVPSFRPTSLSEGLLAMSRRMSADMAVGCP